MKSRDQTEIIRQLQRDFQQVFHDPAILGVILYGSYATGEQTSRSDIDVCVVAPSLSPRETFRRVVTALATDPASYDIHIFEELPLYLQGEVIEKGIIVLTSDELTLSEYFYRFRQEWTDQRAWHEYLENTCS